MMLEYCIIDWKYFFKICSRIGITDFCFIVELEYCIFKLHTMIVTFYENNELNRNWNSLFDDIFECNNLIKIENANLDLCCTVRLFELLLWYWNIASFNKRWIENEDTYLNLKRKYLCQMQKIVIKFSC